MKHLYAFFVIIFSFHSIAEGASITLPTPTGAYSVGTNAIEMSDPTWQMFKDKNPRRNFRIWIKSQNVIFTNYDSCL